MELITISTYTLPHEMAIHKSKLEAEGIECFSFDELTAQVNNFYSNAIGGIKLKVKKEDVNRAQNILNESFDLKADYPESKLNCPFCNSGNVNGKGLNGRISILILMITRIPIPIFSNKFHCFDCYKDFKLPKRTPNKN